MLGTALLVVLVHAAAAIFLSWGYFRRYAITRPPIGVFNLWDVAIMIGAIVLVPYLYLALAPWFVGGLLAIGSLSALYFMWEPVLRSRWAIWLATILLAGADLGAALTFGTTRAAFFLANNIVLMLVIVGLTNLWAQSGMQARDVAVLGGALAIYDFIATWQLPLMTDLFSRVAGLPFAPLVAWRSGGPGLWLGIGLGDLLLAAVFPLVMRKSFGWAAGVAALASGLAALGAVLALPLLGVVRVTFPVMIVLGPLMIGQYLYWQRRRGQERTMWQYLQAEPPRRSARSAASMAYSERLD
jgi:hypothetical protein